MGNAIPVRDLQPSNPPTVLSPAAAQHGPRLAPRKVIQTYDADEWEEFIEEWATGPAPALRQGPALRRAWRSRDLADAGVPSHDIKSGLGGVTSHMKDGTLPYSVPCPE